MCEKAVDNYPHLLEFVSEPYKTQKMCDKAIETCPSTIKFVLKNFMTQEICDKLVNLHFFVFDSIFDWY